MSRYKIGKFYGGTLWLIIAVLALSTGLIATAILFALISLHEFDGAFKSTKETREDSLKE